MSKANLGKYTESLLNAQHEIYEAAGLASIDKREAQWSVQGYDYKTKRAAAVWPKKADHVDFDGPLSCLGGVSCFFDAKETQQKRFDLSGMDDDQVTYLLRKQRAGAWVFVLIYVRHPDVDRMYLVDVQTIADAKEAHRWRNFNKTQAPASLSLAVLEQEQRVPFVDGLPDWLQVIRKLAAATQ